MSGGNNSKDNNKPQKKTDLKFSLFSRKKVTGPTTNGDPTSLDISNMKISQQQPLQDIKKDKPTIKKDKSIPTKLTKSEEKPTAFDCVTIKGNNLTYVVEQVVGSGSFGVVVKAIVQETNEVVAIKKVLQDKRYKNRELQIMQSISHINIVTLKTSFYSNGDKPDEVFLNLVLEYMPDTVYRMARQYSKSKTPFPIILAKVYSYQLLRSLAYIHSIGICHRDIKPQNLLLDPEAAIVKLCDFGSAKVLVKGEPNVSYICSRYYRAPELIFGSTNYTTTIDIWSAGCVLAELLLGQPLFPGESGVDQLVEIIKVLGTPSREEIQEMNHTYTEYKFPPVKGHPWQKVFRSKTPQEAIDLVTKLLKYSPSSRLKPLEACTHTFFDELRLPNTALPNGKPLPPLFNFTESEIKEAGEHITKLIPPHFQI